MLSTEQSKKKIIPTNFLNFFLFRIKNLKPIDKCIRQDATLSCEV
jgi:hypothetical protein